jgi:hypothetical protein
MKLRIKGNSLRLRISQSEMARLLREGRIEETIRFAPAAEAALTYALELGAEEEDVHLEYRPQRVAVVLSTAAAKRWAESDDVGVYGDVDAGEGTVALLVEKDFACLDGNDPQDADAFPNPSAAVC